MIKRLIISFTLLSVTAAVYAGNATVNNTLAMATAVVTSMVAGKSPLEVQVMADELALALSERNFCGVEAVQSLTEVGINFDTALEAIAKACSLSGPQLSALARSLAPGMGVDTGGPGGMVSGPGPAVSP